MSNSFIYLILQIVYIFLNLFQNRWPKFKKYMWGFAKKYGKHQLRCRKKNGWSFLQCNLKLIFFNRW